MRFRLMSVDAVELAAIRADALTRPLTYPETGATFTTTKARYYFHDSRSIDLGTGAEIFAAAKRALRRWAAHQGAGATITPANASVESGQTVTVNIPVLGGHVIASCRIVAVVDEPDAFGFAYGTLTDHPERGEESFVVRRDAQGHVTFTVTAFSRPRELIPWIGLPVVRFLQHRAARAFLAGMHDGTDAELATRNSAR